LCISCCWKAPVRVRKDRGKKSQLKICETSERTVSWLAVNALGNLGIWLPKNGH
jgi:hypothetical protein